MNKIFLGVLVILAGLASIPLVQRDGTTVIVQRPPLTLSERRDSIVAVEARKVGVPVAYAVAVSHVENTSGDSTAVSKKGAVGIMQVIPRIWQHQFEDDCGCGSVIPMRRNACLGVHILALYRQRYGSWARAARAYHTGQPHGDEYSDDVLERVLARPFALVVDNPESLTKRR